MSLTAELVGVSRTGGEPVYLLHANDLVSLPESPVVDRPFAMLLAGDAGGWDKAVLSRLASTWLDAGLAYACCWGEGCEWVHDVIDEADLAAGVHTGVVMTTWHDREPVAAVVQFFALDAVADDNRFPPIKTRVAIVVGDADLAAELRQELARYVTDSPRV